MAALPSFTDQGCACRNEYHHYGLWRPKVVFTIHNAEYGLDRIGSAAYYSQRFTTVSPSYAGEVRARSCEVSWSCFRMPLDRP